MRHLAPLLVLCGLAACSPEKGQPPADAPIGKFEPTGEALSLALHQTTGVKMSQGNELEIINNGDIFPAIREQISNATSSVNITVFIWAPGAPGDAIVESVVQKAREGVSCRIIVDPVGSPDFTKKVMPQLVQGGCDVRMFRPLGKSGKTIGRNHRKMVIVDGKSALTGGFGFSALWIGHGREKEEWRDTHLLMRGPAVEEMQQSFAENWMESGGRLLPKSEFPKLEPVGKTPAVFVSSKEESGGTDALWMTRVMAQAAKKRLWITNAYFVPSDSLKRLLLERRRDGVDVRILVPGPVHDVPPWRASQRAVYKEILAGGIRVWEYQPSMIHSKTMVVDGHLSVVGSINLDPLSLYKLDEGSMLMEDVGLNARLAADFLEDLKYSVEMTEQNRPRPTLLSRLTRPIRRLFGNP
jgi:cardiolipin synthase A/B